VTRRQAGAHQRGIHQRLADTVPDLLPQAPGAEIIHGPVGRALGREGRSEQRRDEERGDG